MTTVRHTRPSEQRPHIGLADHRDHRGRWIYRCQRAFGRWAASERWRQVQASVRSWRPPPRAVAGVHCEDHVWYIDQGHCDGGCCEPLWVEIWTISDQDRAQPEGLSGLDVPIQVIADHHRLARIDARPAHRLLEHERVRFGNAQILRGDNSCEIFLEFKP